MGCSWIGKATVQATLCTVMITEVKKYPHNPNYKEYYDYANSI